MKFTDKQYWDSYWEMETRERYSFYFADVLDQYIPWDKLMSYMEIGGAPGSIMSFMYKEHGLKVSTVDFTEKERIESNLESLGVNESVIINKDFETMDVSKFDKEFDIVASWGFLEHFEKEVTAKFIEKKKSMVSDNGYLIIELPNIRKIIWLLYWLFNRKLIKIHNLEIMDLKWLEEQVDRGGEFERLYSSYYFTMNTQNEYFEAHPKMRRLCQRIVSFFHNRKLSNSIRKWFYPYIMIIAKRT